MQSETVCTVHGAEWDCVYSARCRVRLCVQCTVQSETVYSARCRLRLCVQCTVQSETVCTVHSAEWDCVYSVQCRVRLCVQCTVQSDNIGKTVKKKTCSNFTSWVTVNVLMWLCSMKCSYSGLRGSHRRRIQFNFSTRQRTASKYYAPPAYLAGVCLHTLQFLVGRDSSVGIATRYELDGRRIESRWRRDFPHPCRSALGHTQPPVQWVSGLFRE